MNNQEAKMTLENLATMFPDDRLAPGINRLRQYLNELPQPAPVPTVSAEVQERAADILNRVNGSLANLEGRYGLSDSHDLFIVRDFINQLHAMLIKVQS